MIGTIQRVAINKILDPNEGKPLVEKTITDLIESITQNGLMHPITLQPPKNEEDGKYKLIAGRHRLNAHRRAKWETIYALVTPKNLTADEALELHLHENLKRHNMPWYEQVQSEKELHDLRQRQYGVSQRGRGKSGWSLRDTAKELDLALGQASEDLQLARALEADPTLKNVQDKTTALKLIREEAQRTEQRFMASIAPAQKDELYLGEASEVLSRMEAESFDACITDPPWLEYKDKSLTSDDFTIKVFKELYRVLRKNSFLYAFVSTPDFYLYHQELPKFGFIVQDFPLIWVKQNMFSHGLRSWEYGRDYELIILAVKGKPALSQHRQNSSIYEFPVIPPALLTHPNEKPVALIERIMKQCTFDASRVIDPFAGSGVVLEVAKKLGRKYVGIEREHTFFEKIVKRLEAK